MLFVATADWQLGKQAGVLPPEARARYAQARLEVLLRIGEKARLRAADFVVVSGDVFESNQLDRMVIGRALEAMKQMELPVYLLPGNHDHLGPGSIYDSAEFLAQCPANVQVLRKTGIAATVSCADGTTAQLLAAPWHSKDPGTDLVSEMLVDCQTELEAEKKERQFRVVVGHGNVSTLQADRNSLNAISVPFLQEALDSGLVDFVALGDRHGLYEVASRIWYPGTPEVTAEREIDPGNILFVSIDPNTRAVEVEAQRVGTWDFLVLDFDVNGSDDIRALESRLSAVKDKASTSVKLVLKGTLTVRENAELEMTLNRLEPLFGRLVHWDRHKDLAVIAEETDFSDLNLGGFALEALNDLKQRAAEEAEGHEVGQASGALALLYRLAGGGQ